MAIKSQLLENCKILWRLNSKFSLESQSFVLSSALLRHYYNIISVIMSPFLCTITVVMSPLLPDLSNLGMLKEIQWGWYQKSDTPPIVEIFQIAFLWQSLSRSESHSSAHSPFSYTWTQISWKRCSTCLLQGSARIQLGFLNLLRLYLFQLILELYAFYRVSGGRPFRSE